MKVILTLLLVAAIIAGAYYGYPYFAPRPAPAPVWSQTRAWQSADGRSFEGRLVAAMNDEGVFLRQSDGLIFRLKPAALGAGDAEMLRAALGDSRLAKNADGIYHLRRRLEIPGQQAVMYPNSSASIGPRIAKSDASYWLFLTGLDGSSPRWVRIDGDAYRRFKNDTLVSPAELTGFMKADGQFLESLPWPRTDLLLVEAKYGLSARRLDVTRVTMGLISNGDFPRELGPRMFQLPDHHPDVWDLVLTWARADGSLIYRTVRDGQILTWP